MSGNKKLAFETGLRALLKPQPSGDEAARSGVSNEEESAVRRSDVQSPALLRQPSVSSEPASNTARTPPPHTEKAVQLNSTQPEPLRQRSEPRVLEAEHSQSLSQTNGEEVPEGAQEDPVQEDGQERTHVIRGATVIGRRTTARTRKRDSDAAMTRPASLAKNIGTVQVPYVRLIDNVPTRKVGVVLQIDLIRRVKVFSAESGVSTTEFFEHAIEAELARRGASRQN